MNLSEYSIKELIEELTKREPEIKSTIPPYYIGMARGVDYAFELLKEELRQSKDGEP